MDRHDYLKACERLYFEQEPLRKRSARIRWFDGFLHNWGTGIALLCSALGTGLTGPDFEPLSKLLTGLATLWIAINAKLPFGARWKARGLAISAFERAKELLIVAPTVADEQMEPHLKEIMATLVKGREYEQSIRDPGAGQAY